MGKVSGDQKSKQEITITYMMMCIVTVFLITQFPYYLQSTLLVSGIIKPKFGAYIPFFVLFSCIFATLNSTVNTMIYCIFNKEFRNILFQWLPLKCSSPGNNLHHTITYERPRPFSLPIATQATSNYYWFVIHNHVIFMSALKAHIPKTKAT